MGTSRAEIDLDILTTNEPNSEVSIQLMSPASGNDLALVSRYLADKASFHSINVPSEWEQEEVTIVRLVQGERSFHSINVPSEWELYKCIRVTCRNSVSIQLMSPASGNPLVLFLILSLTLNWFPFN